MNSQYWERVPVKSSDPNQDLIEFFAEYGGRYTDEEIMRSLDSERYIKGEIARSLEP